MKATCIYDLGDLASALLKRARAGYVRHILILISWLSIVGAARAALIVGPSQLSLSGFTGVETIVVGSFAESVDGVFDEPGMNSNNNGVSLDILPLTVTYNFDVNYDLTAFGIHGEFGSNNLNAVRDFQLIFLSGVDGSGIQVGATFSGTHTTPSALQWFDLSAGSYLGVRSFQFIPLSVQDSTSRVEWSEIQFDGTAAAVPEPASAPAIFGAAVIGYSIVARARRKLRRLHAA
jgi:hypothetical protein